ncbi:hypothetical protein ACIPR8_11095 [Stenotrophomonas sp. LARHCG68]
MDEISRLVETVFSGDWTAYWRSLPERKTVEQGNGRWHTESR